MNFFQRRKILKKVNYLDLTPVRLMEYELKDDGKIDIHLPRFKRRLLQEIYRNPRKGDFILIHLDEIGSAIWNSIDGTTSVHEICNSMNLGFPEKLKPESETEKRVTDFLSLLYRERYITFRQIQD